MVVVATTFDTDARSKIVFGIASWEFGSNVNLPHAFNATISPACVTAIATAGKARLTIAARNISNGRAKTES